MGQGPKLFLCVVDFILFRFFEVEPLFSGIYEDIWDEEEIEE